MPFSRFRKTYAPERLRAFLFGFILLIGLSLPVPSIPPVMSLMLETLQRIRLVLVRVLGIKLVKVVSDVRNGGVHTPSAGSFAHGFAWNARRLGIQCTAVVPDGAPHSKSETIQRLGA